MERIPGTEVGQFIRQLHEQHGHGFRNLRAAAEGFRPDEFGGRIIARNLPITPRSP